MLLLANFSTSDTTEDARNTRGYNIWGKARAGPVVVVHPAHGGRYFRTSVRDAHGDTRTISQKKDGDSPPPYLLVPFDWSDR